MSSYLDRIGAGLILSKPEVFGFDYIPNVIVGRESTQGDLAAVLVVSHIQRALVER